MKILRASFFIPAALVIAQALSAATPVRTLIIDGQNNHDWKKTTPVLKKILEDTGMFQVDVLTTPPKGGDFSTFRPEFAKYQLVVGNYNEFPNGRQVARRSEVGVRAVRHERRRLRVLSRRRQRLSGLGGLQPDDRHRRLDGPQREVRTRTGISRTASWSATPRPGCGQSRRPHAVPGGDARHPSIRSCKGLPAKWMHAADELYSKMRGPGREHDRAGDRVERSGEPRHGARRADADGADLWQGPRLPHHAGPRSGGDELRRLHLTLQRGAEWAATGKVTQKVPTDFPTADKESVRQ